MKKTLNLFLLMALFIFIISGISQAALVNDLVTIPTADLINQGAVGADIMDGKQRIEAAYIISPGIEVGGEANFYNNKNIDDDLGLLLKMSLVSEDENTPEIAGGLRGEDLYFSFSKNLSYGTRGHIGVGNGQFGGIFVGINKVINPVSIKIDQGNEAEVNSSSGSFPPINLMAEYVDGDINFGLRSNIGNNISFDFGVINLEDLKAGISYSF